MSLKAPVVASKTIGPSREIEFMGIILDSVRMEARLPQDKLIRINQLLDSFKNRRSVRLVELQSLIGTLQFACKVVVPGRTFLQRAINLTRGVPSRFHHIRLNKEFFKDLAMWKIFLSKWNGRSFFLESTPTPAQNLELYTDAAGSIGFGGYFQGRWFQGAIGPRKCSWTNNRQLVLNGKSSSPSLLPAPYGTLFSPENAFNSGAIIYLWYLLQIQGILRSPALWIWLDVSSFFPCSTTS